MDRTLRLLIVEDSEDDALLLARLVEKGGFKLEWRRIDTAAALSHALASEAWDAIICDYAMPRFSGPAALKTLQESGLDLPFLMVSGRMGEETAVEVMRAGAHDYLLKESLHRLLPALERELREAEVRRHQRQAEWSLRTQEKFLRQILDAVPAMIYTRDRIGRFTMVNRTAADFYGTTQEDLLGRHLSELLAEEATVERCLTEDREVLASGETQTVSEDLVRVPGGEELRWQQTRRIPIVPPGSHDVQVLGVSLDITDRKRAEEHLQHDALHDAYTGLPNRALFMERVAFALAHHRRARDYEFAVLSVETDTPHPSGGVEPLEVLEALAERLRASVRTNDTVARVGASEFAVLLDGIEDPAAALRAAERVHERLTRPMRLDGREMRPQAAIGIALGSTGYDHAGHLVRDAGTAMVRAKSSARPLELFDRRQFAAIASRIALEADLRRALSDGAFLLHYQPIVALGGGRLLGLEALARWQRGPDDLAGPAEFLPTLRQAGLMAPLGAHVLQEACDQVRRWNREHPASPGLWVSVNLSAEQLAQSDLIEQIDRILRETGAEPAWLRLEASEAAIAERPELAAETLARLRDRGLRMLLDDLGSACTSLSRLPSLPFDILKIDRPFVQALPSEGSELGFVRATALMAHCFGMAVLAEGVETLQQRAVLEELGCDYAQGYLFSHAVPAAEATQLIAADQQT